MMPKLKPMKFKAVMNDSGHSPYWEVWNLSGQSIEYLWAEFHGPNCMRDAQAHSRTLNKRALSRESK